MFKTVIVTYIGIGIQELNDTGGKFPSYWRGQKIRKYFFATEFTSFVSFRSLFQPILQDQSDSSLKMLNTDRSVTSDVRHFRLGR
jgi:hypothetical protein